MSVLPNCNSLMYPHVQEQNLGQHVKFLQTTEYEFFYLPGLLFFPCKHLSPEGGSNQESTFL